MPPSVISRGLQVPPNEAKKTNDRRAQACPSMTTAKAGDVHPQRSRRWRRACQVLELHRIRNCVFSPPPAREEGRYHRGTGILHLLHHIVSHRIVPSRIVPMLQGYSSATAYPHLSQRCSVSTIVARTPLCGCAREIRQRETLR